MATATTATLLATDAKPPKSTSAQYYAIHPSWQDVSPIPQKDQTGTLAAIAYSPRYSEAMAYLRAVMADNEVSGRALALTEDLISMNPAHYTVWIYRIRILKSIWLAGKDGEKSEAPMIEIKDDQQQAPSPAVSIDEELWVNVRQEIEWLDQVSIQNLKNYQIWHHRHALADLFPVDSQNLDSATKARLSSFVSSEQTFLAQILSLDTKNYHVWSYRQWLCSRFPSLLLPSFTCQSQTATSTSIAASYRSHPEVAAIDFMISDDLRNNSAWSHRYYILFGHHELTYAQSQTPPIILKTVNDDKLLHKAGIVDADLATAEIEYTKSEIRKAPQNGSTWNYLRGVIRHSDTNIVTLKSFCEEFLGPEGDLWTDQWVEVETEDSETGQTKTERQQIGVRSSHAIEWLSEIYGSEGPGQQIERAKQCLKALGEKWDPVRKGYWSYRAGKLQSNEPGQAD